MPITSHEFAALARGQLKKKMVTRKPKQGGKLGAEPTEYSKSHQQKKIKPNKAGGNFTYGNPIGYNY